MAPESTKYDGAVGAATLNPLERTLAAAIHEHREIARRQGREVSSLSEARAVCHVLARFLMRGGAPAEMTDAYAVSLACATLKGAGYSRFKALERLGVGPHEALHQVMGEIAQCFPAEAVAAASPDLRAEDHL